MKQLYIQVDVTGSGEGAIVYAQRVWTQNYTCNHLCQVHLKVVNNNYTTFSATSVHGMVIVNRTAVKHEVFIRRITDKPWSEQQMRGVETSVMNALVNFCDDYFSEINTEE